MTYSLQFDGMLHTPNENPLNGGLLGYGWRITRHGLGVAYGFGLFGHRLIANSNAAEYLALIEGLEASVDLRIGSEPLEILGDAKCVIDQMSGAASVSAPVTRMLYRRAQKLAAQFRYLAWGWVPRSENKLADQLSRRGLRQLYTKANAYESALNQINADANCNKFIPLLDLRVYTPLTH